MTTGRSPQVPKWVSTYALAFAAAGAVASLKVAFGLPVWQTSIALALSTALSYVAVRCVGETNINPIGGIGKVAQVTAPLASGSTILC